MARQRKLTDERRSLINQLLATYKPEDAEGVNILVRRNRSSGKMETKCPEQGNRFM